MKLIIAEKPMLAKCIAAAIPGTTAKLDGALKKGDYVITWSYGHLLTLKMPQDYDEAYKKWTLDALPIYFPHWGKTVGKGRDGKADDGPAKQLAKIGQYLKQADMVIHAGDPDDEGQYLVDELLEWFNYKGPVQRLATGDTSEAALRKALQNMDNNSAHVRDGQSAYARSVADLMVGVNLSRYFTLKNDPALLTIGRVQTPTLGLVVKRDLEIEAHHKVTYYTVKVDLDVDGACFPGRYVMEKDDERLNNGYLTDKSCAEGIAAALKNGPKLNGAVAVTQEKEQPPLPFNLTELKLYCEKHWGYTPDQTLDITQRLRDRYNAISYNRSDCRYLSSNQHAEAPDVMAHVVQNIHFQPKGMDLSIKSRAFDDAYVQGSGTVAHLAIIPQAVNVDLTKLDEQEKNVYLAICKYYMAQFMPPAVKKKTKFSAPAGDGGMVEAVSTVVTQPGYRAIFRESKPEMSTPLSQLPAGKCQAAVLDASIEEGTTKPPAPYTQAELGKDMTRIAKYVSDPKIKEILLRKDKDNRGENGSIGTEATRASIISGLIDHQFLESDKKGKLHSTPLGRELCRILPDELVRPDLTALWWAIQEDIKEGRATADTLTGSVLDMINKMLKSEYPKIDMSLIPDKYKRKGGGVKREPVGVCPRCGKPVIEGKQGFGCSGWKEGCKFVLWKTSMRPMFKNVTFTESDARKFLAGKPVLKKNLAKKDGGTFEAYLVMHDDPSSPYGPNIDPDFTIKTGSSGGKKSTGAKRASPAKPRGRGKK